ncbi:MAG TPA: thioredoxin, partial [Acidimicrobiaceae bacterium]|nr:thioredoxin [Acidimicrobiaceae bacterium]
MTVDTAGSPTDLLEVDDDADLIEVLASLGWGGGLPVVAPTPERVDEMLAGCPGYDPDEVVATLPP